MFCRPLMQRLRSVLTQESARRRKRVPQRGIEVLELRTLLAAVSDDNGTLQIELSENEQLSIVSQGDSYALASDSNNFTDAGVADAAAFAGFGTNSLILNDLAAYSSVHITDSASGASLRFNDSGSHAYQHSFAVDLTGEIAGDQAVGFEGASHFGDFNLAIATDRSIRLFDGSSLTTNDGDIQLTALNEGDASGDLRGIGLDNAAITSTGQGQILLTGTGTSAGPASDFRVGVWLENGSVISSTATTPLAGTIAMNGLGGSGTRRNNGVLIESASTVASAAGDIVITGDGGQGTGNSNYGVVILQASIIESTGTGDDAAAISITGTGGDAVAYNIGVLMDGSTRVSSVDGDISVVGAGGNGTESSNRGVHLSSAAVVESTGTDSNAATITIDGTGGSGTESNSGVRLSNVSEVNNQPAEIRSVSGAISVTGQGGGNGTGDINRGLDIQGRISSTGTGVNAAPITIAGTGGTGTTHNHGVIVSSAEGEVLTLDGAVTIFGAGGDGDDRNEGVKLQGPALMSTRNGDIVITGQGGTGDGDFNRGVYLLMGATIQSTGTGPNAGDVVITGTGGAGDANNHGVQVASSSTMSSVSGDIEITGTGSGTGANNYGVHITDASLIESTGTGSDAGAIAITGTGSSGTNWNLGLAMGSDASIRTVDGDVVLAGQGGLGSGDSNRGISMSGFGVIESTGTGEHAGEITIDGSGGTGTHSNLGVFINGEASQITSQDGSISLTGTGGAGDEIFNSGVWLSAPVESQGTGSIDIVGIGGSGSDSSRGITVSGTATEVSVAAGAITIAGTGGSGDGGNNGGVQMTNGATINSTATGAEAGAITVTGTGGSGADWNNGVTFGSGTVIRSIDGDIDLQGTGGTATGSNNHGMHMENFEIIESTGTGVHAGTITVTGVSGTGAANNGGLVVLGSSPLVRTFDGDIALSGEGAGTTTGNANGGLWLAATVQASGTAAIDIVGSAGTGTVAADFLSGVDIAGTDTVILSNSGPITITGTSSNTPGDFHHGVTIHNEVAIVSTDGDITLTGDSRSGLNSHGVSLRGDTTSGARVSSTGSGNVHIAAAAAGTADALHLGESTVLGHSFSTGNISLVTDTIDIHPAAIVQSTGTFAVEQRQPGLPSASISLGGAIAGGSPDLNLTDAELATLQSGFTSIAIGTPGLTNAESVVAIDTATFYDPVSIFGGTFRDEAGIDITAPAVTVSGATTPGQPIGKFGIAGDLRLDDGSTLLIEAAGSTPGEGGGFHDQVSSTGRVDIGTNVALQTRWIPTWQAEANDVLVIVSRTGGSGTFAGLPEGATLPEFFNATISYVGGTGDDIVLTLPDIIPQTEVLNLSGLGSKGVTIFGADAGDQLGQSVNSAGDVNGDGIDDFLIGANKADSVGNQRSESGEAYLIYGSDDLPETIDLANLGDRGVIIHGANLGDITAHYVDAADINGDTYSDIIIGALGGESAYVVFGGPDLPKSIDLASLGSAGITIKGSDLNDLTGNPVAEIGDINGDEFPDFAVGAIWADSVNNARDKAGETHVIFGGSTLPQTIDLATATSGVMRIFGAQQGDESGVSIAGLGDVNDDGIDDLIIGARYTDGRDDNTNRAGESYIIYGNRSLPASIDLATDGAADVTIYGVGAHDFSGHYSRGGGDVNGDGHNDIVIGVVGADSKDNTRLNAGESHIIFGGPGLPATIDLATLGAAGVTFYGVDAGDESGRDIDIVGDLNGDGFDDVAISARGGDGAVNQTGGAGETYVIFGRAVFPQTLDLRVPGTADQILFGIDAGDESGIMVRGAGDVNDDGVDDLIIGARYADSVGNGRLDAGEAYVVFGVSPNSSPGDVDGSGGFDANDTFLIHLTQLSGTDVQIDQSKGSSPLTATRIRDNIAALDPAADVDGDGDFDANDSFLIHLVKLAGTNVQIDQSKGSSLLTAAEIRARINALGNSASGDNAGGDTGRNISRTAGRKIQASSDEVSRETVSPSTARPSADFAATSLPTKNQSAEQASRLFGQSEAGSQTLEPSSPSDAETVATDSAWDSSRSWLDAILSGS